MIKTKFGLASKQKQKSIFRNKFEKIEVMNPVDFINVLEGE